VSSLTRRIEKRIRGGIKDVESYREFREKQRSKPDWGKPLLKRGRIPRILRRSPRSEAWLEARAAKRAAVR
jgi:hypothetical protein